MSDCQYDNERIKAFAGIGILRNPVQEYAWGSYSAIQDLLGKTRSEDKPMAELWMGVHPKAPSELLIEGKWEPLNEVIERCPESILGKNAAGKFSNNLPFLFKVLAAARPLSIQVHPNLRQAREGFDRENSLEIPIDAPNRNYRDNNHKPEIICALIPFIALKGFRKVEEILDLMDKLSPSSFSDDLSAFKMSPDPQGLRRFFTSLMTMRPDKQKGVVTEAVNLAKKRSSEDRAFYWMIELDRVYPGDIGVLSPLYLNLIELEPGEALYLPAGELHAYLEGIGVELMANSDNVLRGGLTPKYVDVPQLLEVVNFEMADVKKIEPAKVGSCERIYPSPAEEFSLSVISVCQGKSFISAKDRNAEIMICTEGRGTIEDLSIGDHLSLIKGNSVIVSAAVDQYVIAGEGTFYKASVPL